MSAPVEVVWDKDDFLHLIDEAKRSGYRQAIADLRDHRAYEDWAHEQRFASYGTGDVTRAADFLEFKIGETP